MTGDTANGEGSVTGAPDPIDRPGLAGSKMSLICATVTKDRAAASVQNGGSMRSLKWKADHAV
jgi:hypothetical protein